MGFANYHSLHIVGSMQNKLKTGKPTILLTLNPSYNLIAKCHVPDPPSSPVMYRTGISQEVGNGGQVCGDVEAVGFPVQNVYKTTYGDENATSEPLAQTDHRHYKCEKYSLRLLKHRFGIMPRFAPGRALNP